MTREQLILRIREITDEMCMTVEKKNADYGSLDVNPFKNFTMVETIGVATAEQGFYTRILDKVMRIGSYIRNGKLRVADEKVTDTITDLAVYLLLLRCYLEDQANLPPAETNLNTYDLSHLSSTSGDGIENVRLG